MNLGGDEMNDKEALAEIEERIRITKDRRMYERLQTIRLRLMGKSVLEIAEIMNRSDKSIRNYLHAYKTEGLSGLTMRFSPGPNQRLTQEQRESLKQVIVNQVPADVGFTATFNWTLQIIADYIEQTYGYTYSIRGVSKLMERMGMSYTKPTYTLASADPQKQQQFVEETFPALKKG